MQHAEYRYDPLIDGDIDVGGSVDAGMCEGPFGVPYPCVDIDVDVDVDIAMQDPERDRTPEEMSHGPR